MNTNESNSISTLKFEVHSWQTESSLAEFLDALRTIKGVIRLDINTEKNRYRLVSAHTLEPTEISRIATERGINICIFADDASQQGNVEQPRQIFLAVEGMTCRSCEVIVERKFKKISGVTAVDVNAERGIARIQWCGDTPDVCVFRDALGSEKYSVTKLLPGHKAKNYALPARREKRPTLGRIIGFFLTAGFVFYLFTKLGLVKTNIQIGESIQLGGAFMLGLVAAVSSCVATVGGLLITSVSHYQQRIAVVTSTRRITPVLLFIGGRILSYTILGGVIGLLGVVASPSPFITGAIVLLAAFYMIIAGLDMLAITPSFLKRLMPRMPKALSHRLMDFNHPFLMGAGTFFIPCAFTQALQLYALTTGSFVTSALVLGAFALGTAPALSVIGLSLTSAKGNMQKTIMQFAGALVVIMGFFNIQNGFTIMGYPLSLSWLNDAFSANAGAANGAMAEFDGNVQTIRMAASGGYQPSQFTVKAGVPVRWIIDATNAYGCERGIQSRQLGLGQILDQGINTLEFTAPSPGTYSFSCSMGMYRGTIRAI